MKLFKSGQTITGFIALTGPPVTQQQGSAQPTGSGGNRALWGLQLPGLDACWPRARDMEVVGWPPGRGHRGIREWLIGRERNRTAEAEVPGGGSRSRRASDAAAPPQPLVSTTARARRSVDGRSRRVNQPVSLMPRRGPMGQ